jgi:hypothetical protein
MPRISGSKINSINRAVAMAAFMAVLNAPSIAINYRTLLAATITERKAENKLWL